MAIKEDIKPLNIEVNGIQRMHEYLKPGEISNVFRRKWLEKLIKEDDNSIRIMIGRDTDTYTWRVDYKKKKPVIQLYDNNGKEQLRFDTEKMTKKAIREYLDAAESKELITCPNCGSNLNRVGRLLPTSCQHCDKHGLEPEVHEIIFKKELEDDAKNH